MIHQLENGRKPRENYEFTFQALSLQLANAEYAKPLLCTLTRVVMDLEPFYTKIKQDGVEKVIACANRGLRPAERNILLTN